MFNLNKDDKVNNAQHEIILEQILSHVNDQILFNKRKTFTPFSFISLCIHSPFYFTTRVSAFSPFTCLFFWAWRCDVALSVIFIRFPWPHRSGRACEGPVHSSSLSSTLSTLVRTGSTGGFGGLGGGKRVPETSAGSIYWGSLKMTVLPEMGMELHRW